MTPDTLEGSIHDLTQNILADYTPAAPLTALNRSTSPTAT